jgi:hypothetical protein
MTNAVIVFFGGRRNSDRCLGHPAGLVNEMANEMRCHRQIATRFLHRQNEARFQSLRFCQ